MNRKYKQWFIIWQHSSVAVSTSRFGVWFLPQVCVHEFSSSRCAWWVSPVSSHNNQQRHVDEAILMFPKFLFCVCCAQSLLEEAPGPHILVQNKRYRIWMNISRLSMRIQQNTGGIHSAKYLLSTNSEKCTNYRHGTDMVTQGKPSPGRVLDSD